MLGYQESQLESLKAIFTASEINQQPDTWSKTFNQVLSRKDEIQCFIDQVIKQEDFDIIFSGAGTSEFVGNALFSSLSSRYAYRVKSYATTDIVGAPGMFISPTKATLMISFGRSGSSPESVAAIDLANQVGANVYHLFVTCNDSGEMAKWFKQGKDRCLAIILSPETCDKSFAMTSSFSNMLLAAYLSLTLNEDNEQLIQLLVKQAKKLMSDNYREIQKIIDEFAFKRIVYLGSNALKGIAQESALKMLELTAGQVVCMYDTPLGFRHGPKSIINDETLCVVYLSDDEYTRTYEIDLIKEMSPQRKGNKILAVVNEKDDELASLVDYVYDIGGESSIPNILLGLNYICVAQIIGLYKSMALAITPDNPCPTGEVNRVVKGVIIHPYNN